MMGEWRGSPHDLDMAMTQRESDCTAYLTYMGDKYVQNFDNCSLV